MQKNERLHSAELLSISHVVDIPEKLELSPEDVEKIFLRRTGQLLSIKGVLSRKLQDALAIKIDIEKRDLLEMISTDAKQSEETRQKNKVLDSTYFKKKSLNIKSL